MTTVPYQNVTLQALPSGGWDLTGSTPSTPIQPAIAPTQPVFKVGRPKGPEKLKKTLYLSLPPDTINQLRLDLTINTHILIKDESDLTSLALDLLATLAADPSKAEYLKQFYKKHTAKR